MSLSIAKRIASRIMRMSVVVMLAMFGVVQAVEEPTLAYALSFGGAGQYTSIGGITVDEIGNTYLTGSFTGMIDFDPGPGTYYLTSNGKFDVFVMKLNSIGEFVWAVSLGAAYGNDGARLIALDESGSVLVVGSLGQTAGIPLDLDPGPGTQYDETSGREDVFVLKLNQDGEFIWANILKNKNNEGLDRANAFSIDSKNNVYVVGTWTRFSTRIRKYVTDGFMVKLDKDGILIDQKIYTQKGFKTRGNALSIDANDNVFFFGTFDEQRGNFIRKYNPLGEVLWEKNIEVKPNFPSTKSYMEVTASTVGDLGSIYLTGFFSGRADFDPGSNVFYVESSSTTAYSMFVMKLGYNGELIWVETDDTRIEKKTISINEEGDITIGCWGCRNNDLLLYKYNPMGTLLEKILLIGRYHVVDKEGNIFTIGTLFENKPLFNLSNVGIFDAFLSKLVFTAPNLMPEFNLASVGRFIEGVTTSFENLATDPDGDDITITASNTPVGFTIDGTTLTWTPDYDQAGVYEIELTADDGNGGIATATLTITVENTNRPPVASAGADIAAECAGVTTAAQLDGSGSSDPDGDEITYAWSADGIVFGDATSDITTGEFPLGETTVTLTVSDEEPLSDSDEAVVSIVDTTPPTINYTQTATELWPPNHNMATAIEGISATDACGGDIVLNVTVSSDEDGMGGAGNTEEDWDVITDEDGSQSVTLRAERSGNGDGREYTVVVTATDASGNSTEQTLTVAVPLSKGNVSDNGNGKGRVRGKEAVAPLATSLNQNYPNPFNAETQISFDIASTGMVRLELFDITGRTIRTLVDQTYTPGRYRVTWDGRDGAGNEVASGMYIYRLSTGTDVMTKRLMLLR